VAPTCRMRGGVVYIIGVNRVCFVKVEKTCLISKFHIMRAQIKAWYKDFLSNSATSL
jgi:hypothetical protein